MNAPPPTHSSRRFLKVDLSNPESAEFERLPRFREAIGKIDIRLQELGKGWRIRSWQAAVTAELLEGRDVIVSAQTGSGKTMCYFGLPIVSPETCVMVICPLLALMSEQVRSAEDLGIRAVHLCAETIQANEGIIQAVRRGEYSMVFLTAEFTSVANEAWKSLISEDKHGRLPNFSSKLRYIVVDEVHLVHEWRTFRPWYRNLGLLRTRFSGIPILGVSATLSANTLEYVHKSLLLNPDTILCSMGVDRRNITLFTVPLARGDEASMRPLKELVPEAARLWAGPHDRDFSPASLPKTLIFVDDRGKCCSIVSQLQALFPRWCRSESCNWAGEIIREYHSAISSKGLEKTLGLFRRGVCRYLVCTEAVGMGLDIPDIERVIQWKLSECLTMNCWWQRAGRAGRNPDTWAVAILFYEQQHQLPKDSPLSGSHDVESELEKVKEYISAHGTLATEVDSPRRKKERESHMLWYVNSRGCIREVVMDFYQSRADPRDPSVYGQPCCDRCFRESGIDPNNWRGYPVACTTPFRDARGGSIEPEDDTSSDVEEVAAPPKMPTDSVRRIGLAVRLALECHRAYLLHGRNDCLKAKHLLPDAWIELAASRALSIRSMEDLKNLTRKIPLGRYTAIGDGLQDLLAVIRETISKAEAPRYAPRVPGTTWVAPPEKPLYDASQIMMAPPTVAQNMKAANDELRVEDLAVLARKEKARESRAESLRKSQSQREATRARNRQSQGCSQHSESVFSVENSQATTEIRHPPPPRRCGPNKRKEAPAADSPTPVPEVPKQKRGRPLGSKNKPKP